MANTTICNVNDSITKLYTNTDTQNNQTFILQMC